MREGRIDAQKFRSDPRERCRSGQVPAQLLHEQHQGDAAWQVLEAFFVNVQAKVLAHGFVAAFDSHHEIWMLPGDPTALVRHLSRYVISEDVTVELADATPRAFRIENDLTASSPFVERSPSRSEAGGAYVDGDRKSIAIGSPGVRSR